MAIPSKASTKRNLGKNLSGTKQFTIKSIQPSYGSILLSPSPNNLLHCLQEYGENPEDPVGKFSAGDFPSQGFAVDLRGKFPFLEGWERTWIVMVYCRNPNTARLELLVMVLPLAVMVPGVILDLRRKAKNLLQVHLRNLGLMVREARRLLERGDVRDAAEKAYAAYKSLLGALAAKHINRLEVMLLERITEDREKGLREARWWLEKGLEIPSRAVGPIALTLANLLGDDGIAAMADHAILLHKWFYGGDELVEGMTREKAEHTIRHLLDAIERKIKQYLA